MFTPRSLLRSEGLAVLTLSIWLFTQLHGSWFWFAVLILSPDIFMIGYLVNRRAGATLYNLVHTYAGPAALIAISWYANNPGLVTLTLIWTAHIGFDRLAGFGLKYKTAFKDTHLQRT